jgi:hypothetical protein
MVAQEFAGRGRSQRAEAGFDGFEHEIADDVAADAGAAHGLRGEDFAVVGVDDEGEPDDLAVPAGDLQHIGAPWRASRPRHPAPKEPMSGDLGGRRFERMTTMRPSWTRPSRRPLWRWRSSAWRFMMR